MRSLFVCLFALSVAVGASAQSSKLTGVLADLVRASGPSGSQTSLSLDSMPQSVQDAVRGRRLRIDANNEVQVYILVSAVTDESVKQLTDAGVTIEIRDAARRRVQAHLPVARLNTVAQLAVVDSIRLPTYARRRSGSVTTEGDAILFSDAVRTQLSLDGTGVRVGVISDGLKGVFAAQCTAQCPGAVGGPIATGDLPSSVGVRNASGVLTSSSGGIVGRSFQANNDLEGLPPATPACAFAGAGAEGTALLEIVHDIAPGAKLSFANFDTDLAFNQAVNFLAASNDVVLDDIGFLGEPYDGTSGVSLNTAAALNNPDFPIRAYFTSVGNDADEHYYGTYVSSGVDGTTIGGITNPGRLHLFQRTGDTTDLLGLGPQPFNVIALPPNGEVAIFLNWNDPFGGSANNYDLYLVQQSTGRVVASSTDVQSGRQDPVEVIDYVNRTGQQDFFRIVVQNVRDAAQPRDLNIFSFQPECAATGPLTLAAPRHERHNFNTATRSVSAQSDAGGSPVSVISVGAICSASAASADFFANRTPNESCLDATNRTAEFFSSRGPTVDGRPKPDIAAIDGVTITGAGSFGSTFFGTSAAAPHMGGIAALLLQGAPCLLNRSTSTIGAASARGTVRSLLLGNAVKLSTDNPDNVFGAGRADAFSSLRATLPSWHGPGTTLAFDANSTFGVALTPAQLGFTDPNSCSLTALTWTGGCGTSPGTTMTCPAGTNAVTVSASNNNFAFGATADLQIVVTDFSVDVTPPVSTLAAGASSTHVVTVTPQNGAYNTEITLSCANGNLPPQTTCAFDPPTVTPGRAAVRATLTVSTTARTAATTTAAAGAPAAPRAIAPRAAGSGLALFPGTVGFGTQTIATTSPPQFVSLTNIGTGALAISSISISGDFTAVNNCGSTVSIGASCGIAITFTPTAAGARTGSVSVVDDASGSPHTVTLSGTGQTAPASTGGTPAGSYTIGVSGSVGTLSHFGSVILTVQ
jgi:subtilase family protein/HYDIN/CFA65/VesB family protein